MKQFLQNRVTACQGRGHLLSDHHPPAGSLTAPLKPALRITVGHMYLPGHTVHELTDLLLLKGQWLDEWHVWEEAALPCQSLHSLV